MTLIKSISGIRGTIGGKPGDNLTPIDAVKYAAAYGSWVKQQRNKENYRVVVGRDARISGDMIQQLVMNTLIGLGIHVVDVGLSITPTVEMAVTLERFWGRGFRSKYRRIFKCCGWTRNFGYRRKR